VAVKENPYVVQQRALNKARDAFTKAAAALIDVRHDREAVAYALIEATLGLQYLVDADQDQSAKKRALQFCRNVRSQGQGSLSLGLHLVSDES
jgi:hypothetical protein